MLDWFFWVGLIMAVFSILTLILDRGIWDSRIEPVVFVVLTVLGCVAVLVSCIA